MTLKAFLFLFVVTLVAVVVSALIAEQLVGPGFERGVIIAVLSGLVVFPAARWAEHRGWIKGEWSPGGELRKQQDARKEREARKKQEASEEQEARDTQEAHPEQEARPDQGARKPEQIAAAKDPADPRSGDHTSPGDSR